LKNKLLLQKHFNLQEESMDKWPFWLFEENINLVNEIVEEEDKHRKDEESEQQKSMGNFDANSMMKNATNNMPKF